MTSLAGVQPRTPDRDRSRSEVLRDSAETMRDMLALAEGTGVTFALECHEGSIVATTEEASELMRLVPELRFAYDPSHFAMNGVHLEEALPLLEFSVHVHLRDAAPGRMQAPFGEGAVDFDWILARLQEHDYRGDLSVEYLEEEGRDLRDDIRRLYDKIRAYFEP